MEQISQKEKLGLDNIREKLIELKKFISRTRTSGDASEVDAREFYDIKIKLEALLREYKSLNPVVRKGMEALRSQVVGFSLHLSEEKHLGYAIGLIESLKSVEKKKHESSSVEVESQRALVHESTYPGKGS